MRHARTSNYFQAIPRDAFYVNPKPYRGVGGGMRVGGSVECFYGETADLTESELNDEVADLIGGGKRRLPAHPWGVER